MNDPETSELTRILEQLRAEYGDRPVWWMGDVDTRLRAGRAAADVVERDDEYVVVLDLPGYEKSAVDVRVRGRRLHVHGEREPAVTHDADEHYVRQERRAAASREIEFPTEVRADAVDATMVNGVLTVTVPKAEPGDGGHHVPVE